MKRILILTAGFGEGHNSAARGVRAGLARVAPKVEVELRDLFPETFGAFNEIVRRTYLALINRWPKSWGYVYNWLDRKKDFDKRFEKFRGLKKNLGRLLDRSALSLFVAADLGKRTPLQKHRRRHRLDYDQRDLVSLPGRLFPGRE